MDYPQVEIPPEPIDGYTLEWYQIGRVESTGAYIAAVRHVWHQHTAWGDLIPAALIRGCDFIRCWVVYTAHLRPGGATEYGLCGRNMGWKATFERLNEGLEHGVFHLTYAGAYDEMLRLLEKHRDAMQKRMQDYAALLDLWWKHVPIGVESHG